MRQVMSMEAGQTGRADRVLPVLLCGGSGTRLWPVSRQSYPKQFATLDGGQSLLQSAALRLSGPGFLPPTAVTTSEFRFLVTEQLASAGVDVGAVVIEPQPKNTGPAILAAALMAQQARADQLILVTPSDHRITDADGFRDAVDAAVPAAVAGKIVAFGIAPTRPETGYGWLKPLHTEGAAPWPMDRFVEKPDLARAEDMLSDGGYLWNAGIYLARADVLIGAYRQTAPELVAPVEQSVLRGMSDLGFFRLDPKSWSQADSISIDYAVMERSDNLVVMPFDKGWSDLGDWAAVLRDAQEGGGDANGNLLHGSVTVLDCEGSLLHAGRPGQHLVALGVRDLVAVAMPDAVLVAHKSRVQDVKKAVDQLRAASVPQAQHFSEAYRPWGTSALIAEGDGFQVRKVVVKPGGAMRLQSHMHRAEHWVVVQGTARVTLGDSVRLVPENESIYVPVGVIHRVENPGKLPVLMIEVHTGRYLSPDDVQRHDAVKGWSDPEN